jgi:hypothetical protein
VRRVNHGTKSGWSFRNSQNLGDVILQIENIIIFGL